MRFRKWNWLGSAALSLKRRHLYDKNVFFKNSEDGLYLLQWLEALAHNVIRTKHFQSAFDTTKSWSKVSSNEPIISLHA